jgi:hypothetical protein
VAPTEQLHGLAPDVAGTRIGAAARQLLRWLWSKGEQGKEKRVSADGDKETVGSSSLQEWA